MDVLPTPEPPTRNAMAEALRDGPAALRVNRMRHADTYKAAPREEDASAQGRLL